MSQRARFLVLTAIFALLMFMLGRLTGEAAPSLGPQAKITERIA